MIFKVSDTTWQAFLRAVKSCRKPQLNVLQSNKKLPEVNGKLVTESINQSLVY